MIRWSSSGARRTPTGFHTKAQGQRIPLQRDERHPGFGGSLPVARLCSLSGISEPFPGETSSATFVIQPRPAWRGGGPVKPPPFSFDRTRGGNFGRRGPPVDSFSVAVTQGDTHPALRDSFALGFGVRHRWGRFQMSWLVSPSGCNLEPNLQASRTLVAEPNRRDRPGR